MEVKINLSNTEYKELISYCNLNDLLVSSVVKDSFTTGFNIERYGLLNADGAKEVIKEVVVEKKIEVPVEVIKEVIKIEYIEIEKPIEIIKEVPVERVVEKIVEIVKEVPVEKVMVQEIVKEIPVDKIVYVTDQQELNDKIFQKEQEFEQQRRIFSNKTQEMENIFQQSLAKKDKDLDELRQTLDEILAKPAIEKIVEVIKEVPVEIIKEVIIEKETSNDNLKSKLDAIQNTLQKLKQENIEKDKKIKDYEKIIEELKIHQDKRAAYLRGSNLDNTLYK